MSADKTVGMTGAQRQARLRAQRRASGSRSVTVWLDAKASKRLDKMVASGMTVSEAVSHALKLT